MDTKGCVKLTSNETYFDDIWFIGANIAEEEIYEGLDYCGHLNMRHKSFCLATL